MTKLSNFFKKIFTSQKIYLGDDKKSTLEFVTVFLGPKNYAQQKTDLIIPVCDDLVKYFALDLHNRYIYVTQKHLNEQNININELENCAIKNNFKSILENNKRELSYKTDKNNNVHMFCNNNKDNLDLYSSLVLNPLFWGDFLEKMNINSPIFCIPSKYMIAITDSQNKKGIKELKGLINVQIGKDIEENEFVSNKLFTYQNGKIELFKE